MHTGIVILTLWESLSGWGMLSAQKVFLSIIFSLIHAVGRPELKNRTFKKCYEGKQRWIERKQKWLQDESKNSHKDTNYKILKSHVASISETVWTGRKAKVSFVHLERRHKVTADYWREVRSKNHARYPQWLNITSLTKTSMILLCTGTWINYGQVTLIFWYNLNSESGL